MFEQNTRNFYDLWKSSDSSKFTRVLSTFCATQSGPYATRLLQLIADNDILGLCTFELPVPTIDQQAQRFYMYARQTLAFYEKDGDIQLCDTELVGWEGFQRSELKNRFMNYCWSRMYQTGELFTRDDGILFSIGRKISDILQDAPKLHDLNFGFGPGASATVKQKTSPRYKLDAVPACSEEMSSFLQDGYCDMPHYWELHQFRFNVVAGELSWVVKNAKTKRSILIEPTLNTPYQKSIGQEIRNLLKKAGCDLSTQSRNQELALYGSLTEEIVTVDVKNASNSMFLLLVYHLIWDEDWFQLMSQFRTGSVEYQGKQFKLEMFSSMGNGFTFELESLIFYAIAMAVCERCKADTRLVSVYGDDIIVPKECYAKLKEVLDLCGFEVNSDKTHISGFFRESCGKDFSYGQNVRPWYKRDRWTNARVVGLLNYDLRNNNLFYELRPLLIDVLPSDLQIFGPDGYGDGHLVTDEFSPAVPVVRETPKLSKKQRERKGDRPGFYFETVVQVQKKNFEPLKKGDKLLPLYNIYAKPSLRKEIGTRRNYQRIGVYGVPMKDRRHERYCYVTEKGEVLSESTGNASRAPKSPQLLDQYRQRMSLTDDPYVLRGEHGEHKIRIYCWNSDPQPHVNVAEVDWTAIC